MTCEEFRERLLRAGPSGARRLASEHVCEDAVCGEAFRLARRLNAVVDGWAGSREFAVPPSGFAERAVTALRASRPRTPPVAMRGNRWQSDAPRWWSAAAAVLAIGWSVLWVTAGDDAVRAASGVVRGHSRTDARDVEAAAESVRRAQAWLGSFGRGDVASTINPPPFSLTPPRDWRFGPFGGKPPAT